MKYRNLHLNYWSDRFIGQLTPEERYFYIYLLTCPHGNMTGIFEFPLRYAALDCGYSEETIEKLLARFVEYGKIRYSESTNEVAIKNWARYNVNASPKVRGCVKKQLALVKNQSLISFVYNGIANYEEWWNEERGHNEQPEEKTAQEPEIIDDSALETDSLFPETIPYRYHIGIENEKEKENEKENYINVIVGIYHEILPNAPKVQKVSAKRLSAFRQRLREDKARRSSSWWREYFQKAAASAWLAGGNDGGFVADFEWLINGNNMLKVIEGRYDKLRATSETAPARKLSGASQLKLLAVEMARNQLIIKN